MTTKATPTSESDLMEPVFRCTVCGKVFSSPEAQLDHLYSVGLVY